MCIQGSTRIYKDIQGYTRIIKDIQGYKKGRKFALPITLPCEVIVGCQRHSISADATALFPIGCVGAKGVKNSRKLLPEIKQNRHDQRMPKTS